MTIRTIVLAGTALLSLSATAAAQDQSGGVTSGGATSSAPSAPPQQPAPPPQEAPPPAPPPATEYVPGAWYFSLAGGWDGQNSIAVDNSAIGSGRLKTDNGPIVLGAIGYKFPTFPVRLELEAGYDWHSMSNLEFNGVTRGSVSGHVHLGSALVNAIYDIPLGSNWAVSLGAGAGAGFSNYHVTVPIVQDYSKNGFMWQGIAGISYGISPQADIFLDYRYRNAMTSGSFINGGNVITVHDISENAVLAGLRWRFGP